MKIKPEALAQLIAYTLIGLGQLYVFTSWLWAKIQESSTNRKFVHALRTNHLPHIERALRAICHKLDLEYDTSEGLNGQHKTGNGSTDRSDQSN